MEEVLRKSLGTKVLKSFGRSGGGCINEGQGSITDTGPIFVKNNKAKEALKMFRGEFESLKAIADTHTIRVPSPIMVGEMKNGGAWFAAEFVEMEGCHKFQAEFGTQLASEMMRSDSDGHGSPVPPVHKFGFDIPTCCGFIPQDNSWKDDWQEFFTEQRLELQVNMLKDKDKRVKELWTELKEVIPAFFKDSPSILPSLLHGDLWSGNIGQTKTPVQTHAQPVIFDPASFYGHSEFDLGIGMMFGGLSSEFFESYHALIPRSRDFQPRNELYQLFHQLNHWNHFGSSYRSSSLNLMTSLIKKSRTIG